MPFPIRIILPEGKCEHVQNSLWENKGLVSSVIFGFILGNFFCIAQSKGWSSLDTCVSPLKICKLTSGT